MVSSDGEVVPYERPVYLDGPVEVNQNYIYRSLGGGVFWIPDKYMYFVVDLGTFESTENIKLICTRGEVFGAE